MNESERIPLSQAIDIYCEHLRLPDFLSKKVKAFALHDTGDVVWLSDQPLKVYRDGSNLAVDSEELTELMGAVEPLE